jgi:hypothetical protein
MNDFEATILSTQDFINNFGEFVVSQDLSEDEATLFLPIVQKIAEERLTLAVQKLFRS